MLALIYESKKSITELKEFQSLPRVYKEYYRAVMNLKYDDTPNYIYLEESVPNPSEDIRN